MKTITNPIPQTTKHGIYTPQYFYKLDGNSFNRRYDQWFSKRLNTVDEGDSVSIINEMDLSPIQLAYNSECSCCYLGMTHSEEKHKQSVKNSQIN